MRSFLIGLLLGTIGGIFAMQNHIVRTQDGIVVVPRAHRPPLRSAVADVRDWSAAMWEQYPELRMAVEQAGRTDLISHSELGNYLNGTGPSRSASPAASHTTANSDVAVRFLPRGQHLAPIGGIPSASNPASRSGAVSESEQTRPVPSPGSPFEAILGKPAPFPSRSDRFHTDAGADEDLDLVFPSGRGPAPPRPINRSLPHTSGETPRSAPAPSTGGGSAAGPDAEWVRGLLKSLIPSAEASGSAERADASGMRAPPPATAQENWKPVSYERGVQPQPPLRAVRPF